ncbi:MAG: hypothetical protein HY508_07550 [Acidobacteria bacterium]|nr:hypothetical protein [Acidobacteriota bacterium]
MRIPGCICDYPDSQVTPYNWLPHPKALTGQLVAHALRVPGRLKEAPIVRKADALKAVGSILLRSPQAKRVMGCACEVQDEVGSRD